MQATCRVGPDHCPACDNGLLHVDVLSDDTLLQAKANGATAHQMGWGILSNPYPRDTPVWYCWRVGWMRSHEAN